VVTLITGENTFENERALARIIDAAAETPEKIDGSELELRQLPDLLMGGTLFADTRLVIIKNLSENKAIWGELEQWLERLSPDVRLVLMETKPDKRTKTYKFLQKNATVLESKLWGERDAPRAEQWVSAEAGELGFSLDKKSAQLLVARVGTDQWELYRALEKLSVLPEIMPSTIENVIEAHPSENVFYLFETALKGDAAKIHSTISVLQQSEDPYRLFGLLSTQALQLAALTLGNKPAADVAKDMGAHPFALSKLAPYAQKQGPAGTKKILMAFTDADKAMKTSAIEPWLAIEEALLKVALAK